MATMPVRAAMAQPRPRKGWRRAPTSLPTRPKRMGATRALMRRKVMTGSTMKTMEAEYQRGLKGEKGRMP